MTARVVITTLPGVRSLSLLIPGWVAAIDPHLHSSGELLPSSTVAIKDIGGRGGIRTHGGLPHARFRVECLKPDSATLPEVRSKHPTPNAERPTANVQCLTATACAILIQRTLRIFVV